MGVATQCSHIQQFLGYFPRSMTKQSSCTTRVIVDRRSGKIFKKKTQQHKSKEENCTECEFSSKNRLLLMMHMRFEHQDMMRNTENLSSYLLFCDMLIRKYRFLAA